MAAVAAPPQFPHYRWRGLPRVVQQQLYRLGVGAEECVLCGARQHGCYACPQRATPNGQAMWQAWERRWLLLQARELELYALSSTEGEYRRRSGALFVRSVVTRAGVSQFRLPRTGPHGAAAIPPATAASPPGAGQNGPPPRQRPQRVVARSPPAAPTAPTANATGAQRPGRPRTATQRPQRPPGTALQPDSKKRKKEKKTKKAQRQDADSAPASVAAKDPQAEKAEAKPAPRAQKPAPRQTPPPNAKAAAPISPTLPQSKEKEQVVPIPQKPEASSSSKSEQSLAAAPLRQRVRTLSPVSGAASTVEDREVASAFRPIQPHKAQARAGSAKPGASRPPSRLGQRTVSPTAVALARKTGRTSTAPGVSPVGERLEVALGGAESVTLGSQRGGSIPYAKWKLERYLQADEAARAGFWRKAQLEQKAEIALAISANYREQDDLYQQARGMGAEAWGLGRGRMVPPVADGMEAEEGELDEPGGVEGGVGSA